MIERAVAIFFFAHSGGIQEEQNPQGITENEYLAQIGESSIFRSFEQLRRESLPSRVRPAWLGIVREASWSLDILIIDFDFSI